MNKLVQFLFYNNAVPLGLGVLFLGAGGVFAATNPEAILSQTQQIISPDNTYIVTKDLGTFTPRAEIVGVTEDEESYFVAYRFSTIDLVDYVWQDVTKEDVMKVSKALLGETRDLGLYVTEELRQRIDREIAYLSEVQGIEKKQVSQKMVATAYSGLVGRFLDDTVEELPGYVPVIDEPEPPPPVESVPQQLNGDTAPPPGENASQQPDNAGSSVPPSQSNNTSNPTNDLTPPRIQMLGNNPARLTIGSSYSDLGIVVTDDVTQSPITQMYLNGNLVTSISIDTSVVGEWVIVYDARDLAGNMATAMRRVEVYDATAPITPLPEETPTTTPTLPAEGSPEEAPAPPPEETPPPSMPPSTEETPPAL
ncbi:MAG: immunoglobulin-like domain-containing protein [Patescibacteria group bacterium]